jgi:hypothetical protein
MAAVSSRRPLISLVKITSKKNKPELISFKYGNVLNKNESDGHKSAMKIEKTNSKNEVEITAVDQFLIPEAGEASKAVKMQVIKILDLI